MSRPSLKTLTAQSLIDSHLDVHPVLDWDSGLVRKIREDLAFEDLAEALRQQDKNAGANLPDSEKDEQLGDYRMAAAFQIGVELGRRFGR